MTKSVLISLSILLFLSVVTAQDNTEIGYFRPKCQENLLWVPSITQMPFTLFINSLYCPSWFTRDLMTKFPRMTQITLPKDIPFSMLCGACYTGTTDLAKTIELQQEVESDAASPYTLTQVPILGPERADEFVAKGHKCRVQYGITTPIIYPGSFKCNINLGRFQATETVYYSVSDVPVERKQETLEVSGPTVTLQCPKHPMYETLDNPLVHVWYLPNKSGPRFAAPTNDVQATFRLVSSELVVSCATYHMVSETMVYETTYTVRKLAADSWRTAEVARPRDTNRGSGMNRGGGGGGLTAPANNNENYYVREGEMKEEQGQQGVSSAGLGLNTIMLVIISATAIVLLLITVLSLMRCFKTTRRSR